MSEVRIRSPTVKKDRKEQAGLRAFGFSYTKNIDHMPVFILSFLKWVHIYVLVSIFERYINKKIKYKKIKNILEENKKTISEKNIPERPGNYRRLVEKDQNIQD